MGKIAKTSYVQAFAGIAIILAVLLWYAFASHVIEMENRSNCVANLSRLGELIRQYQHAHSGARPDSLATLVRDACIENGGALICPSSKDKPLQRCTADELATAIEQGLAISYVYVKPDARGDSEIWMYEKPGNHPGGRLALLKDGVVRWIAANEEIVKDNDSTTNSPTRQSR